MGWSLLGSFVSGLCLFFLAYGLSVRTDWSTYSAEEQDGIYIYGGLFGALFLGWGLNGMFLGYVGGLLFGVSTIHLVLAWTPKYISMRLGDLMQLRRYYQVRVNSEDPYLLQPESTP